MAPVQTPTTSSLTPIFRAMDKEAPMATVQTAQAGLAKALTDKISADKKEKIFNIKPPLREQQGKYIEKYDKNQA